MMQQYKIADLYVDMDVSGRTLAQAEPYRNPVPRPADLEISVDPERILREYPKYQTADIAEYMGTGVLFARRILDFQGYYLHSSAIVLDGKAYLFTAPSGTGKSTHTEKWVRLFGAHYLNDDKPVLRLKDGVWMAYGTPWSGKHDLSSNEGVHLGGIACLRRGEENTISPMAPADALPMIMSQTVRRLYREQTEKQLVLVDRLLRDIPIWDLSCRNDDEAANIAKTAMTQGACLWK